ncbi:hypothetical protein ACA910_009005 [Epithemia clementina (nom. ined.)]
MYELGWYDPIRLLEITDPPNGNLDIPLTGFAKPAGTGLVLVKIVNPLYEGAADTKHVYFHFNWKTLRNAETQEAANMVTVTSKTDAIGTWSYFIGRLSTNTAPLDINGFFSSNCVLRLSVTSIKIKPGRADATVRLQNLCQ